MGHIGPVALDPSPLRFAQFFQAFSGRCLVSPLGHRQDFGMLGMGQVSQQGRIELVPLFQTELVDAHVGDDSPGIDLLGLGVGELVADDETNHLGGDAESAGHFFLVAADEQPEDVVLEAVGVADLLAAERRGDVLAVVAAGATVVGGLINPEAGLIADVQVPDDLHLVGELQVGGFIPVAAVASAAGGQGPGDFKAVAIAVAMVSGDGDVRGQIDFNGDGRHRGDLRGQRARSRMNGVRYGPLLEIYNRRQGKEKPKKPWIGTQKRKSQKGVERR